MAEFLKRHCPKRMEPGEAVKVQPCALADVYPAVVEFLTLDLWDDGGVRVPGTLLLCFGEGRWKCWVNDRDADRTAWLSADTLSTLLLAVERGILDDTIEWRAVPKKKGGGKGR